LSFSISILGASELQTKRYQITPVEQDQMIHEAAPEQPSSGLVSFVTGCIILSGAGALLWHGDTVAGAFFCVLGGISIGRNARQFSRSKTASVREPVLDAISQSEHARILMDALGMPAFSVDQDGMVISANTLASQVLPTLIPGKPLALGVRDPDVLNAIEETHSSGIRRMIEWTEAVPLQRIYRIRIAPLGTGLKPSEPFTQTVASSHLLISLEDLSEQRVIERTRVDFVANASHELRTPLAAMLGFIETLQGPARDDNQARERFLIIMREQGLRMSRLIDDLLSLSRIEQRAHQTPEEKVNLNLVVREIVDMLTLVSHERGVILSVKHTDENVMALGDRDELLRLAENLIENAIKYGGSGGRVEIEVRQEDEKAILSVRDFGQGIAAEHIPRLTERFYRVDVGKSRNTGGTGLGLALVKHIILHHKGRLAIESPVGGGALFVATLRSA
jgi:two-component system, OmpR family, phosphate regulon sensor histidine kinase PhoR